jgi:hypothetical protein
MACGSTGAVVLPATACRHPTGVGLEKLLEVFYNQR